MQLRSHAPMKTTVPDTNFEANTILTIENSLDAYDKLCEMQFR